MMYLYLNLRILKNNLEITKRDKWKMFFTVLLGFLTQYFFAIYAFFIAILMVIQMIRRKKYSDIRNYLCSHLLYAVIGIIIFVPCIYHLFFTDRGLKNLGNSGYLDHLITYVKHLAYAFSVNDNMILISIV